jgi:membrane protein DedA with SNARE-associated domain
MWSAIMPDFGQLFDGIYIWLRDNYAAYGYLIVLIFAYLENTIIMGLILPGGTFVILGGVFAAQGQLSLPLVILTGWVGMWLGTSTDYWIGRAGAWRLIEKTRLRRWLEPGLKEASLLLKEKGGTAIFMGHLLGQIRTFVAVTAGIVKMPFQKFGLYEFFAAGMWNLMYIGAGYFIGGSIDRIENIFQIMAGVAVVVALAGLYFWKKQKARQLETEMAELKQRQNRETEEEEVIEKVA